MEFTEQGALLADTFGLPLLAYLLAIDEGEAASRLAEGTDLGSDREAVLRELLRLATQVAAKASDSKLPVGLQLDALGRFDDNAQTSIGNMLRTLAGGAVEIEIPQDPVGGPLVSLVRDAYPLMLIPEDRTLFPRVHLGAAVWTNPHRPQFEAAVLADPDLSSLFVEQTDSGGWSSSVIRSTGSAGGLQLWSLSDMLLTGAWWGAQLSGEETLPSVAEEALRLLDLIRRAARSEPCEVRVLMAFTGLILDPGENVETPFGLLRPLSDHERDLAPQSIEGHVSHTTSEGESVTASYAGDVVLDTSVAYRIRVEASNPDGVMEWPPDMRDFEIVDANVDTIRLASLLTGEHDASLTLQPTWRMVFDPLSWGPLQSWRDPRSGPSIAPRQISSDTAKDFGNWISAVHQHRRPNFDVAIRRIISAWAVRVDHLDALVDLVIAWENLFGSRKGEPTLRISASIGWLLGSDPETREMHRASASKTYALRSDIVHGNRTVPAEEAAERLMATRRMTLDAMRILFRSRPDLLALKNGDERSRALLMGA